MKQFVVIAYDIADDKRRQKIAKILSNCGVRCNFSVFECVMTESQIKKTQMKIEKIIDQRTDCVLYYYLCKSCVAKRGVEGKQIGLRSEIVWI